MAWHEEGLAHLNNNNCFVGYQRKGKEASLEIGDHSMNWNDPVFVHSRGYMPNFIPVSIIVHIAFRGPVVSRTGANVCRALLGGAF